MIPAETRYETYNSELLSIVEVFKIWRHYLKGFQYKFFVLIDHNTLQQFINTKSLSSKQVCWAQEFFCYYFQIDYHQSKVNRVTDALFQYPQQSTEEEKTLQAKNMKILHCLQSLLTKVSGLAISQLSPLYQIFICKTTALLQLHPF